MNEDRLISSTQRSSVQRAMRDAQITEALADAELARPYPDISGDYYSSIIGYMMKPQIKNPQSRLKCIV